MRKVRFEEQQKGESSNFNEKDQEMSVCEMIYGQEFLKNKQYKCKFVITN